MAQPGFSDKDGEEPLIETLARGWGVQSRCVDPLCHAEGRMTARELLDRFHRHLDTPVRDLLARAVCRECGGAVKLYTVNTHPPFSRPPSDRTWTALETRELMVSQIREFAASQNADGRTDYAAAKAR